MASGGLLLRVGAQSFVTSHDIPVQPGSRIQLEVQQIEPRLVLRLLNTPVSLGTYQPTEKLVSGMPVNNSEFQALSMNNLFKSLGQGFQGSSISVADIRAMLANNFLVPGAINPSAVRTALVLSGIFTEALWLSHRPSLGAKSNKTILMILRQRIASSLESSGLSSAERLSLARLLGSIDSSISSITHQQISSLPQDGESSKWLATLPMQLGDEVCDIDVEIKRRARHHDDDDAEWKFSFSLTLEKLGPVTVLIKMDDGRLRIDVSVSSLMSERMTECLPLLRNQLSASGLELDHLGSHTLKPGSDEKGEATQVSLNISV
jgi:hypothetical protein